MIKFVKKNMHFLALCALEFTIAILLLINPEGFTSFIVIAAGLLIAASGVWSVVQYLGQEVAVARKSQSLSKGLLLMMLGLVLALKSGWFMQLFTLRAVLYGVALVVSGVFRLQAALDAMRTRNPMWKMMLVTAAAVTLMAVIIMLHPAFIENGLWVYCAVALIITTILDGVGLYLVNRKKPAKEENE